MKRLSVFLALSATVLCLAAYSFGDGPVIPGLMRDPGLTTQDADETDPHYACDNGQCVEIQGCGISDCSACQCNAEEAQACQLQAGFLWTDYPYCRCDPLPVGPDCSACAWYADDPPEDPAPCWLMGGGPFWNAPCECCEARTPLLLTLSGRTALSAADGGVLFDFDENGKAERVPWPTTPDNGWLVWDRNGNGFVDDAGELVGNRTPLPDGARANNGFEVLRALDRNRDGLVDSTEAAVSPLMMWRDWNRNGTSEAGELVSLPSLGVSAISCEYSLSRRRDEFGNLFRYRAPIYFASAQRRFAYDVILTSFAVPASEARPVASTHSSRPSARR